jgi:hypothetical protein
MSVSFLLLLAAALVFRFLGLRAQKIFRFRTTRLLGSSVKVQRLAKLLRAQPDQVELFRGCALPYFALQLFFDSAACLTFIAAVFLFPPEKFGPTDLALLQQGSIVICLLALFVDLFSFCRIAFVRTGTKESPPEAE